MRLKDDTIQMAIHPYLTDFLLRHVDPLYSDNGGQLVITSGNEPDPVHSHTSLHYAIPGCAVDIRSWEWVWDSQPVTAALQYRWILDAAASYCRQHPLLEPGDIDVVLESNHIHVELQPKRRSA